MTNEKIRPEEQDLEVSEKDADEVSGGVNVVLKAEASADKVSLTDPNLSADL